MVGVGAHVASRACRLANIRGTGDDIPEGVGTRYPDADHVAVIAYNTVYTTDGFYKRESRVYQVAASRSMAIPVKRCIIFYM